MFRKHRKTDYRILNTESLENRWVLNSDLALVAMMGETGGNEIGFCAPTCQPVAVGDATSSFHDSLVTDELNEAQTGLVLGVGNLLGIDTTPEGQRIVEYEPYGKVVGSVSLDPDIYVGITIVGGRLFASTVMPNGVYEINPASGARTLLTHTTAVEGLGRYGRHLLAGVYNGTTAELQILSPTGLEIVRQFALRSSEGEMLGLMGIDGDIRHNQLFAADYLRSELNIYDVTDIPSFSFLDPVQTIPLRDGVGMQLSRGSVTGLAYDPALDEFWVATASAPDNTMINGDDMIRRYARDGTLISESPTLSEYMNGLSVVVGRRQSPEIKPLAGLNNETTMPVIRNDSGYSHEWTGGQDDSRTSRERGLQARTDERRSLEFPDQWFDRSIG